MAKVLLVALLIFISSATLIAKERGSLEKPNVLFISIDDLNDWAGFLENYPHISTPNIDRLAKQGVAFSNAHCQAPICAPSRASLMTGLYPHTTGLYYQFNDIQIKQSGEAALGAVMLPDYFENNGYKTLAVGKVFHGGDEAEVFQEYGGVFPKMKFGPRFNENRLNYDPTQFSDKWSTATDWGAYKDMDDSETSDYKIADWAVDKLDTDHDKPFFMAVGFVRPHVPWHVPQKWFDMFDEADMVTPPYLSTDMDDIPEISQQLHDMPAMPHTEWLIKEKKWKSMIQSYIACMAFVDHQVGKVLDALESSDYKNNTIIVLWSDHGYHLGEKNRTCKHSLWRRATHIPLIFAGAGIPNGLKSDKAVQLIDIYPTLTELCKLPENIDNQGNNLTPLLTKPNQDWNKPAITSYGYGNFSINLDNYHLITYVDGSGELYDLKRDPNEWVNLYDKAEFADVVSRLRKMVPESPSKISDVCIMRANHYIDKELIKYREKR